MSMGGNGHAVRVVAVAIALVAALATGASAAGVGSWTQTGFPLPWNGGAALRLADGRVLALPGRTDETLLFDPASGSWSLGPTRPSSAANSTPIALADGGALLAGGLACPGTSRCTPAATALRWRPGTTTWTPTAPPHDARALPIVAALADGRILALGGFGDDCAPTFLFGWSCRPIADAEIYDPGVDAWSPTAAMPSPRAGAAAATLSDGTVLVVGGAGDGRDAIRYRPDSGTWTSAGQTAVSRTGGTLLALPGNRALTFGGGVPYADFYGSLGTAATAVPPHCNASSETYDGGSGSWTPAPPEPGGTTYCPDAALLTDRQVLATSVPVLSRPLSSDRTPSPVSVLDARQRCWTPTAPPPELPDNASVVALRDGRALMLGDFSNGLLYTPGSPRCPSHPARPLFRGVVVPPRPAVGATPHVIAVPLQCLSGAVRRCVGAVSVAVLPEPGARHSRELAVGRARFAIATGRSTTLRFRVPKRVRARLSANVFVDLAVRTTAHDDARRKATRRSVWSVAISDTLAR